MIEDSSKSEVLIKELFGMVDEFLQHMSALEAENQDLRARLSSGVQTAVSDSVPALVVDPDPSQAAVLGKMLTKHGCLATEVHTGGEALALCETNDYSVIIVESNLDDGKGLEVLKKLAESAPDADLVIIVGFTSADIAVQAMRLGAADFFLRPFSEDDLDEKLKTLLKQQQFKQQTRRLMSSLRERYQKLVQAYHEGRD